MRLLIKEDAGWYGRSNFTGKSFDSVVKDCFKGFSVIKCT